MRTTASLHALGSAKLPNSRQIDATCKRIEAKGRPRLMIEYRDSGGNIVTVTLDDGAVLVTPRQLVSRKAHVAGIPDVDRLNVLLNHE